MTPEKIINKLQEKFGDKILESDLEAVEPIVHVAPGAVADIGTFLKNEPGLDFASLMCLSSVDLDEENLQVVYHLHSIEHKHKITLGVTVPKTDPDVPTVSLVWRTADWHEREAYDLMGVQFTRHPDFRRILCPDDWEGHPLRKDYVVQEFYRDMPVPYPEENEDEKET